MEIKLCECGCGQFTTPYKINDARIGAIKGKLARFVAGHNSTHGTNLKFRDRKLYNLRAAECKKLRRQALMEQLDTNICSSCKKEKLWEDFYESDSYKCKSCNLQESKIWGRANRDRRTSINRKCTLKRRYGLSLKDYDDLFLSQGSCCPICKVVETKQWHVDHDHKTDKVRGILCYTCNVGLGSFKDNIQYLLEAAEYIKRSRANGNDIDSRTPDNRENPPQSGTDGEQGRGFHEEGNLPLSEDVLLGNSEEGLLAID